MLSKAYLEFEQGADARVKEKLHYAMEILKTVQIIPNKFAKKLTNTEFHELRISTNNEVRVILFATDSDNINLCSQIILLNGFVKKSTKDYAKEITKARHLIKELYANR